MSYWPYVIIGLLCGGPIWVLAALWASRRTWRSARRLSARAKGHEHLIELGQLVGGLAHEIKNPLSTINVNLDLLSEDLARRDDAEAARWRRRLESVEAEVHRLGGILDDFLRFAGQHELNLQTADLRRVVAELTDFFAAQADAARVVMRTSLSEQSVLCRIDVDLLKQALLNIMINAVQAMSGGGELLIRVAPQRGRGVVEVIDTGPGVAAEDREKVFQAYYSTKKGGSGLGLPMTRRIVIENGGTIQMESEPGKGTRFIVKLPLVRQ